MSKKMTGFLSPPPYVFLAFCLVMAGSLFLACSTDSKDWEDDHVFNTNLIGTWYVSGMNKDYGVWTDTYIITENTVSHPEGYPAYENAKIEHVVNFNSGKTSGGLIIKRMEDAVKDKPYIAVWFNDLDPKVSVRLGDANDTTKDWNTESTDASVATLEEVKSRFSPANASIYGGADANMASQQGWQY